MPSIDVPLSVRCSTNDSRHGEPVTVGVPFPKGTLSDPTTLRLVDAAGADVALQSQTLDRWADGSVRWALCDFRANIVENSSSAEYRLHNGTPKPPFAYIPAIGPTTEATVRTQVGKHFVRGDAFRVETAEGKVCRAVPDHWAIESSGPLRLAICEKGTLQTDTGPWARYILRAHYFPGTSLVRIHWTLHNPNKADHPGGCWDLGESGAILVRDASASFALDGEGVAEGVGRQVGNLPHGGGVAEGKISPEVGAGVESFRGSCELFQCSSGGDNWKSTNHLSRSRTIPLAFRGYRSRVDQSERSGNRATPIVSLSRGGSTIALGMPEFWQNFPKAIEADGSQVTLRLFPRQSSEPHEIQGGEQKCHVFWISMGNDSIARAPLDWSRSPSLVVVDPEWIAQTKAISYFTPRSIDPSVSYLRMTDSAIEGNDTFEHKREVIDEYGWRHWGDIYGDHEAILHQDWPPCPRASHYNNQYDGVAGFAIQWLRSGDSRWFQQMRSLAHHVRDVDIYNTDHDKAAYNHGLFWHTYHYVDADTGTHRSYPRAGKVPPTGKPVPGGGPGNEQNYGHGLMLDYFLTGDEASREASLGLAQWVVDMDDGTRTIFRYLSKADTGLASASRSPDYHGPGRGSGNSVAALLDGHRLSGDRRFLRKAEQLIRRVIHPADNITRRVGMIRDGKVYVDAENRWFYVMFLQSLGKYLDHKAELGELDEDYAYGQACLLHYARWMAEHEYLYLDRPEVLEYPTETWAAQDLRKGEVFAYAAMHTDGPERTTFIEKSRHFFERSLAQLEPMPTRTLCRPVVLLMTQGWRRAWFATHPDESRPRPRQPITDFGSPTWFVPQKAIAKARAKKLIAVGGLVGLLLVVVLILWIAGVL